MGRNHTLVHRFSSLAPNIYRLAERSLEAHPQGTSTLGRFGGGEGGGRRRVCVCVCVCVYKLRV